MLKSVNASVSHLLVRFQDSFEAGVEVPDTFMIWHRDPAEPAEKGSQPNRLVHRYYVDGADDRRQGSLIEQVWMYTEGIVAFVQDGIDPGDAYDGLEDLVENWAHRVLLRAVSFSAEWIDRMVSCGALERTLSEACARLHA